MVHFYFVFVLFLAASLTVSAQFAGGDGTSGNPYQVATAAHLNNVRDYRTSHFIQTADIDLSHETGNSGGAYWNGGLGWNPIGATEATSFLGSYNGQGYSITGLTINRPGQHYIGLFAYVGNDIVTPVISNVKLVSVSITSNWVCGALAGKITKTTISKCSSTGSVTGVEYMGGLIGWTPSNSTISESYSSCTVTTTGLYTGGFIGITGSNTSITNCYATGNVTSTSGQTGGFAGRIISTNLVNCYSTGAVSGSSSVGGLIGTIMTASATNCFWDTQTSGQASSAGGTGKTTAQMKTNQTFSDAGWNLAIWNRDDSFNNGYPYLDWENPSGTPLPVELTSFIGRATGSNVTLQWKTATEVNNSGFNVERSSDRSNWQTLGFITGHGNSNAEKAYSFTDKNLAPGKYHYRLKQIDTDGQYEYSDIVELAVSNAPDAYALSQNYPNPFNPSTAISFALPQASEVTLKIYNTLGQEVAVLINGETMEAGIHTKAFDAGKLTSGVYIYKLTAGSFSSVKKMNLLK
ncbi:MAG: hypothetical protein FMNOHCHN_03535 [Ignavibacteriaceae bacterium]|nr:hypothetical protein [Ignavibacteriaceae bacterium]